MPTWAIVVIVALALVVVWKLLKQPVVSVQTKSSSSSIISGVLSAVPAIANAYSAYENN